MYQAQHPVFCPIRLNEEARTLISDLGSSVIHSLGYRDNWVFVGGKGTTGKSNFEKVKSSNEINLNLVCWLLCLLWNWNLIHSCVSAHEERRFQKQVRELAWDGGDGGLHSQIRVIILEKSARSCRTGSLGLIKLIWINPWDPPHPAKSWAWCCDSESRLN